MIIYTIFNGYPTDKVVIPMTIILVAVAIVMGVKAMKEEWHEASHR